MQLCVCYFRIGDIENSKKYNELAGKIKPNDRLTWPVVLDSKNTIVWLPGLKKSKLDKKDTEEYDIILRYY